MFGRNRLYKYIQIKYIPRDTHSSFDKFVGFLRIIYAQKDDKHDPFDHFMKRLFLNMRYPNIYITTVSYQMNKLCIRCQALEIGKYT